MREVTRWFLKTEHDEILDGPFKRKEDAEKELKAYCAAYGYVPKLVEETVELEERRPRTGNAGFFPKRWKAQKGEI